MTNITICTNSAGRKRADKKLSTAQSLATELLHSLEGEEFRPFQGQSMEALKALLNALTEAIAIHREQGPEGMDSHPG